MKKLLTLVAVLGIFAVSATPALAHRGGQGGRDRSNENAIRVTNANYTGFNHNEYSADSTGGYASVTNTDKDVDITNRSTSASAEQATITDSNLTDVSCRCLSSCDRCESRSGREIEVSNTNAIMMNSTSTTSTAEGGYATVDQTDGNVTIVNGGTAAESAGLVVTNTNITRVR